MFENLESRVLLSAVPFPTMTGSYTGTYQFSGGDIGTISLSVYSQVNGKFMAIAVQSNGLNSVVKGNVTRTGVVHFTAKPNVFREHGRGAGTFTNGIFSGTEVIKGPGLKVNGTFTLSKN